MGGQPSRHPCETDTATEHLVWDVERLWASARDLPVEAVPVARLQAYLSGVWTSTPLTGRDLADHARRLLAVDSDYPITLAAEGYVMDGVPRIAKASALGRPTLTAVRFPVTPEPDERRSRTPALPVKRTGGE